MDGASEVIKALSHQNTVDAHDRGIKGNLLPIGKLDQVGAALAPAHQGEGGGSALRSRAQTPIPRCHESVLQARHSHTGAIARDVRSPGTPSRESGSPEDDESPITPLEYRHATRGTDLLHKDLSSIVHARLVSFT